MKNKYRRKSVVIEAWQFTRENYMKGVPLFIKDSPTIKLWSQFGGQQIGGEIETSEGKLSVSEDDYICFDINRVAGEFYLCKPDIFEQTYEPWSPQFTAYQ